MSHKLTIMPSKHTAMVMEGESILDAALREGYTIAYGCRNGACGSCKGKILEGTVDYGDHQKYALTESEKRNGLALFCCAEPKTDIVIEAHEVSDTTDIPFKCMPCKVAKIEYPAEDVVVLYLKLPENERLQFLAGQYIDILLKDGERRAYSLANAPHDDKFLQLHIRRVAGGNFSDLVFTQMHEKALLRFEGPLGSFYLREDSDKPILLLASGTGFAPVKAMLEHAFHHGIKRPITLYWGAHNLSHLYMLDLPKKWEQEHANFKFIPVLSEPRPEDQWQGRVGYLHQIALEDYADLAAYQVYACGSPIMVEAAHEAFISQRKLPSEAFYSDAFTFSKPKA